MSDSRKSLLPNFSPNKAPPRHYDSVITREEDKNTAIVGSPIGVNFHRIARGSTDSIAKVRSFKCSAVEVKSIRRLAASCLEDQLNAFVQTFYWPKVMPILLTMSKKTKLGVLFILADFNLTLGSILIALANEAEPLAHYRAQAPESKYPALMGGLKESLKYLTRNLPSILAGIGLGYTSLADIENPLVKTLVVGNLGLILNRGIMKRVIERYAPTNPVDQLNGEKKAGNHPIQVTFHYGLKYLASMANAIGLGNILILNGGEDIVNYSIGNFSLYGLLSVPCWHLIMKGIHSEAAEEKTVKALQLEKEDDDEEKSEESACSRRVTVSAGTLLKILLAVGLMLAFLYIVELIYGPQSYSDRSLKRLVLESGGTFLPTVAVRNGSSIVRGIKSAASGLYGCFFGSSSDDRVRVNSTDSHRSLNSGEGSRENRVVYSGRPPSPISNEEKSPTRVVGNGV